MPRQGRSGAGPWALREGPQSRWWLEELEGGGELQEGDPDTGNSMDSVEQHGTAWNESPEARQGRSPLPQRLIVPGVGGMCLDLWGHSCDAVVGVSPPAPSFLRWWRGRALPELPLTLVLVSPGGGWGFNVIKLTFLLRKAGFLSPSWGEASKLGNLACLPGAPNENDAGCCWKKLISAFGEGRQGSGVCLGCCPDRWLFGISWPPGEPAGASWRAVQRDTDRVAPRCPGCTSPGPAQRPASLYTQTRGDQDPRIESGVSVGPRGWGGERQGVPRYPRRANVSCHLETPVAPRSKRGT